MSSRVKVRADGKVPSPSSAKPGCAGSARPTWLESSRPSSKSTCVSPRVTVNIDEYQPITVSVLGEVSTPGAIRSTRRGVMQALASAGGMTEYADRDRIFVLRKHPTLRRIRFTFASLSPNEAEAATFALQTGDVVVVE